MAEPSTARAFIARNDTGVACAILGIWSIGIILAYWGTWSIDMSALYLAGRFADRGATDLIYAAPPDFFSTDIPAAWVAELAPFALDGAPPVPFVYPPIWAYLLGPLASATDPITFFDITRVPLILAFAGSIIVAWRLMRPVGLSLTAFSLISIVIASSSIPFQFSASLNQPQFLLIFLILLAFERYRAGHPVTAGVLIGLVASVKITPILLAVIFLADREWRALAAAFATAGLIALASFAIAGAELHFAMLEKLAKVEGLVPLVGFNMNFETMMYDFFVPLIDDPTSANRLLGVDTPWVSLLSKVLLLGTTAGALWITRTLDRDARIGVRLILVHFTTVWFGSLAWMHYYTLPLLLAPGLLGLWSARAVVLATGAMAIGFSYPVMMGLVDYALDTGTFTVFYPQHTALFPLLAFVGSLAVWAARQGEAAPGLNAAQPG